MNQCVNHSQLMLSKTTISKMKNYPVTSLQFVMKLTWKSKEYLNIILRLWEIGNTHLKGVKEITKHESVFDNLYLP